MSQPIGAAGHRERPHCSCGNTSALATLALRDATTARTIRQEPDHATHATPRYGDPHRTDDARHDRARARQRAHPSPQLVGQGRLERRQRVDRAQGIHQRRGFDRLFAQEAQGECDLQGPDPQRHLCESGIGGGQAALGPDVGDRDGGTHGQPAPVADDTDLAGGPPQDLHRQDRERDIDPLRRLHLRPGDPRRRSRASASTSRSSADRPATRSVGSRCTSRRSPSLANPGSRSSTPMPGAGCSCRC